VAAVSAVSLDAAPRGWRVWLIAVRPRTLPLAVAPVLVGTGVALGEGRASAPEALAALWCALWLQIGANLANDAFDAARGADGADRLGPPRATAAGWLAPGVVKRAAAAALALAALGGLALALAGGWPILALGALAIAAALAYTGGPWPFGYRGLGEAAVVLFFGGVAVAGTYFVQARALSAAALAAALAPGALAAAVLAVNNLRDRAGDARAGKRTLAVRFGERFARGEVAALIGLAVALPVPLAVAFGRPLLLASLLLAPRALALARRVLSGEDGPALNETLAATARLAFAHGLLCAAGFAWP
jgi:1,4-dihydroxy-2-naphthoate octaprenyltransferase